MQELLTIADGSIVFLVENYTCNDAYITARGSREPTALLHVVVLSWGGGVRSIDAPEICYVVGLRGSSAKAMDVGLQARHRKFGWSQDFARRCCRCRRRD